MSIAVPPRLTAALARPVLRSFWATQFLVYLAQMAWQTLLLWALWRLTGSAAWLAAGLVAQVLPQILVGLVGPGRLAPGRALFVLPLIAALTLGALAALTTIALPAALLAPTLLAGALVEGVVAAVEVPLLQADLARAIRPDSLGTANSAMEFASGLGTLAGPAAAGLVLARAGLAATLAASALIMLLAVPALALWQRRPPVRSSPAAAAPPAAPGPAPALAAGLADALPYVRRDAFLRAAIATRTLNNLLWPVVTLALPLLVATRWHAGALGYGVLLGARGAGAIAGTALGARLGPRRLAHAFFAAWLVEAAAFVALAASPDLAPALACMVLAGVASPLVHVALDSRIGRVVEERSRTSVFGLQRMLMGAAGLAGSLAAGLVLQALPVGPVLAATGAALAAVALAGYRAARRGGGLGAGERAADSVPG